MNSKTLKHFAPVVPLSVAAALRENGMLGGYHLLLAHDVLADPDGYKEIYRPFMDGTPMDIIMDNSLIELGYPMAMDDVLQAAEVVGAKRIVLPDELGELDATLRAVHDSMEDWHTLPLNRTAGMRPIGVVQGKTLDECVHCLQEYRELNIDISIPRVLRKYLGSRAHITAIAHLQYGFRNIHLLGFSDNVLDDIACTRLPGVTGIDSAVPVRAAYKRMPMDPLSEYFDRDVGPRGDYWEITPGDWDDVQASLVTQNIRQVRKWINW